MPDFALATVMLIIPQNQDGKTLLTQSKAAHLPAYRYQNNWVAGEDEKPTQVSILYFMSSMITIPCMDKARSKKNNKQTKKMALTNADTLLKYAIEKVLEGAYKIR